MVTRPAIRDFRYKTIRIYDLQLRYIQIQSTFLHLIISLIIQLMCAVHIECANFLRF